VLYWLALASTPQVPNAHLPLAAVSAELAVDRAVAVLQKHLARLHDLGDHPNRTLGFDHMLVTLLIAFHQPCDRTLRLSYINTGRPPGKYEFHCLGWVASGIMSAATMQTVLARRERERKQNRLRYKNKRAAQLAATKKSV